MLKFKILMCLIKKDRIIHIRISLLREAMHYSLIISSLIHFRIILLKVKASYLLINFCATKRNEL